MNDPNKKDCFRRKLNLQSSLFIFLVGVTRLELATS